MGVGPVGIVGGGVAGLACALRLQEVGVESIVFEAEDAAGGRVRTDRHEGLRLDHGFQILLTAYPEARALLDYGRLELRPFVPGALIYLDGHFHRLVNPLSRPLEGLQTLTRPLVSYRDLLPLMRLALRARSGGSSGTRDEPAVRALLELGFSNALIERFFRPFLGGVFLDRHLETSSHMLDFVIGMFARGEAAVPANGMEEIPRQLASQLREGTIRLGARVSAISADHVALETGESIPVGAVVVATDGPCASRLVPELEPVESRSVTCLYFVTDRAPIDEPILVLDGEGTGPVTNLVPISVIAPSYAPPGTALLSATVLDDWSGDHDHLPERVRDQMSAWFGAEARNWEHVRSYRIEHALPQFVPPTPKLPRSATAGDGIYVCGDHRDTPSLQGAMRSGRLAAQQLLADRRR